MIEEVNDLEVMRKFGLEGADLLIVFLKKLRQQVEEKKPSEFRGAICTLSCINKYIRDSLIRDVEKLMLDLLKEIK